MIDAALASQIAYAIGGFAALAMIAASPVPAALFWGIGCGLHALLAATELAERLGLTGTVGIAAELRFFGATVGPISIAFGALFSLILTPGNRRTTLLAAIALALLMAAAADRLPLGQLPMPLIVLGVLMIAVLVGLRHRPVPGRWLLAATLAAGLAELARHRYLGFVPIRPDDLGRVFLGLMLAGFGITARSTR